MALEEFRLPRTPESRIPHVLLVLLLISMAGAVWQAFVGWRFAVAVTIVALVTAAAMAVLLYVRRRKA